MRSPWKIPCATPAWGAWSLWTMSHPSHLAYCITKAIKMEILEIRNEKIFESPRPLPKNITFSSPHVCASSRHMLPQHQTFPVRQDTGLHSNKLTAQQPHCPMAQGHLMTTETHDEGLILPQAQKMNNHEVPSYFDSLANNTSKELPSGSIPFGKSPMCWHATKLPEFIAKQVPCQSGLFLKHEANVKILLFEIKMMVSRMQLAVPSVAPIQQSQCVKPDHLKIERLENNLCRDGKSWLTSLKFSVSDGDGESASSSQHRWCDGHLFASSLFCRATEFWR